MAGTYCPCSRAVNMGVIFGHRTPVNTAVNTVVIFAHCSLAVKTGSVYRALGTHGTGRTDRQMDGQSTACIS